mgnify:CR=1 FL=1
MAYTRNEIKELEPMVKSGKKRFFRDQLKEQVRPDAITRIKSSLVLEQIAKEAGAIYKIRRLVLVNLDIFDEYLDTFRM